MNIDPFVLGVILNAWFWFGVIVGMGCRSVK